MRASRAKRTGPGSASSTSATGPGSVRPSAAGTASAAAPAAATPAARATASTTSAASSRPAPSRERDVEEARLGEGCVERGVVRAARGERGGALRARVLREERRDRARDRALPVVELEVHRPARYSRGSPSQRLAIRLSWTSVAPTATPAVIPMRNWASAKLPASKPAGPASSSARSATHCSANVPATRATFVSALGASPRARWSTTR